MALQQMATSEKYLQQARETPDIRKSAEIMEVALKYNPYNWQAWRELAAMYRRMGNEERAKTCDFSYHRSEELQHTLEGIASYFKKPEAKVTTAAVSYTVHEDSIAPKDFHQKSATLYDTVHNLHPDKEFSVENQGKDTLKVQVLPGDSFPSFDSWEQLEQKAKRK
jgi:DNA-binding SARP family transcriptional activator